MTGSFPNRIQVLIAVAMVMAVFPGMASAASDIADVIEVPGDIPPERPPEPTCTIEVCCVLIGKTGHLAWHCFTKCTKSEDGVDDVITACSGNPAGLFGDLVPDPRNEENGQPLNPGPDCANWTIFRGAWGPIDTYCGPYQDGHPDWRDPNTETEAQCTEVGFGGGCGACECIEDIMCRIEACCVRYELLPELYGYNSNSSAYTALSNCLESEGVPGIVEFLLLDQPPLELPDGQPGFGAPGWGRLIDLSECDACP